MEQFLSVPTDHIFVSLTNPRKSFDKKQMEDLMNSVKVQGIISPLLVRPMKSEGDYEIVAGERRFRASKKLELATIPVIVKDLTDAEARELQVIENLQRTDLHPLDEALGYVQLKEQNGYDELTIAERVGKSVTYVVQRIQLTNLIKEVKDLFWADRITVSHAIHIARLDASGQMTVYKDINHDLQSGRLPSVKSLCDFIERHIFLDLAKATWKKDDGLLDSKAGSCGACAKRTGFNKSLFPDITRHEMCLDGACFRNKAKLAIERKITDSADHGVTLIKINTGWYDSEDGVLSRSDYELVPAKEAKKENAKRAIISQGDDAGKVVFIRTKKEVKADGTKGLSAAEKASRAQSRIDNQKRAVERIFRMQLLDAIVAKVNMKLTVEDIKEIAVTLYDAIDQKERNVLREEVLKTKKKEGYHSERVEFAKIAPKTDFETNKLLMAMTLVSSCTIHDQFVPDASPLLAAANRYKVDYQALKAEVEKANPIKYPKGYEPKEVKAKKAA
jgi:ParB family transcriptional regulator, chromosome partitioning protein